MPFTAPNFANNNFGGHGGSARRPGAGIAAWKIIQDMLEGPRTRPAETPRVGAIGQVLPEGLNASAEPSKYLVPDDSGKYDDAGNLRPPENFESQYDATARTSASTGRKWEEGLAPNENYEAQADAMAKPRAPSYAGLALRPQDYEPITELQRAEAEYKEALDHSTTFAGQLTRGWSQDRINKAAAKVEMAKAKVESITPQREKIGDEVVEIGPDGKARVLFEGSGKWGPGQVRTRFDKPNDMPGGPKPEREFAPSSRYERDSEGNIIYFEDGKPYNTGVKGSPPGADREGPNLQMRIMPIKDPKTGKQAVDEDGMPQWGWQGYDPKTNTPRGPIQPAYSTQASGKGGIPMSKAEAAIAKKSGGKTTIKAASFEEAVKLSAPGTHIKNPRDQQLYEVVIGGNGEHTAVLAK